MPSDQKRSRRAYDDLIDSLAQSFGALWELAVRGFWLIAVIAAGAAFWLAPSWVRSNIRLDATESRLEATAQRVDIEDRYEAMLQALNRIIAQLERANDAAFLTDFVIAGEALNLAESTWAGGVLSRCDRDNGAEPDDSDTMRRVVALLCANRRLLRTHLDQEAAMIERTTYFDETELEQWFAVADTIDMNVDSLNIRLAEIRQLGGTEGG